MPDTVPSSWSYFARTHGSERRAARRDPRQPRLPRVQRPVLSRDSLQPATSVAGAASVPVGTGDLAADHVEHDLDQFRLARHVRVEPHRADAELLGHTAHRQRCQPLGVRHHDGRGDDLLQSQIGTTPAATRNSCIPLQRQNACNIPAFFSRSRPVFCTVTSGPAHHQWPESGRQPVRECPQTGIPLPQRWDVRAIPVGLEPFEHHGDLGCVRDVRVGRHHIEG